MPVMCVRVHDSHPCTHTHTHTHTHRAHSSTSYNSAAHALCHGHLSVHMQLHSLAIAALQVRSDMM